MDYQETLKYLYDSTPMFQQVGSKAYKEGLENTLALDEHFGHPHKQYRTIHVAGTNGKGSCSHTLAAILQKAGYKTGLYTSPHLMDFRERIRINGKPVSEEYVVRFVEEHRSFFEPLYPSFFELTTAMALRYFADEKVDIAIIEVGLGGRLDCTNIITPDLSIITNISFDHTQFLGDTLEKIASEKAGIIKRGVPVIIGQTTPETQPVFLKKAQETNAPIIFAEQLPKVKEATPIEMDFLSVSKPGMIYFNDDYPELIGELGGEYQIKNTNTLLFAIEQLKKLGYTIKEENVREGFATVTETTGLMGRWQKLKNSPTLICDTGHNIDGISFIVRQLKKQKYQKLHIVIGMVNDKDIKGVMALLPKDAIYYFTKASVKRALDEEELLKLGSTFGLKGESYPDVASAVRSAQEKSLPEDFIFVGGSNFIVADLLTNRNALNLD